MTFPRSLPLDLLTLLAIVMVSLLLAEAGVTLGRGYLVSRWDARRERVRDRVGREILERTYSDEPDWEPWVDDLGRTERIVVEDVLETYLRQITGDDRQTLLRLADAMEIGADATSTLESENRFDRLRGLTWLNLLEQPVESERLVDTCAGHTDTRAAAARVLYTQDHADAATVGTNLLLDPGEPLSVLGLDTLYQLTKLDPDPLVERAADDYGNWPESLLIQVLRVLAQTGPASTDASLDWMAFLFVNDSAQVRAAAASALAKYGWHSDIRRLIDVDQLRDDQSPLVRQSVYRLLGEWGDEKSLRALEESVAVETDPRAAVTAVQALRESDHEIRETNFPPRAAEAMQWVNANEYVRETGLKQ